MGWGSLPSTRLPAPAAITRTSVPPLLIAVPTRKRQVPHALRTHFGYRKDIRFFQQHIPRTAVVAFLPKLLWFLPSKAT